LLYEVLAALKTLNRARILQLLCGLLKISWLQVYSLFFIWYANHGRTIHVIYYIQGKLQAKETEVRYSMMRGRGRTTARGGPRERTQIAHTREGSESRLSGPGYEEREGEVKEGVWAVVGRALPRRGVQAASEEP
jgi:hypothetical protein